MSLHNVHSLFPTRMDLTSPECPSLPLFTDRCYIDLCTDLISTLHMAFSLMGFSLMGFSHMAFSLARSQQNDRPYGL